MISPLVFIFFFFRFFLAFCFFFFFVFCFVSSFVISGMVWFTAMSFFLLATQAILVSELSKLTSFDFRTEITEVFRGVMESLEEISTEDAGIVVGSDGIVLIQGNASVIAVVECRREAFREFNFAGRNVWRASLPISSVLDAVDEISETECSTHSATFILVEGGQEGGDNLVALVFSDCRGDFISDNYLPFRGFPRRLQVDMTGEVHTWNLKLSKKEFSQIVSKDCEEVDIFFEWDSDKECCVAIFTLLQDEVLVPLEEFKSVHDLEGTSMVTWSLEGADGFLRCISDVLGDQEGELDTITLVIQDTIVRRIDCQVGPFVFVALHVRPEEECGGDQS